MMDSRSLTPPPFPSLQESLRPDLISSNLNRTHSSSGELNQSGLAWPLPARQVTESPFGRQRVSYNDLCFPKTSNYGSMKKKKHQNVGVSTTSTGHNFRSSAQQQQQPSPLASHSTTYY